MGLFVLNLKKNIPRFAHLKIIAEPEYIKPKLKANMVLIMVYEKTQQINRTIYFWQFFTFFLVMLSNQNYYLSGQTQ